MLRQGLWVGVTAAIVTLPVAARAELVGVVAANVVEGATSNALNAPDGSPAVGADEFTTLRASLMGTYRGPRQDQSLSYVYSANIFAQHSEGDSQTHDLTYTLNALPSGRTEIQALASGAYGVLTSVNPIAAAAALSPQLVQSGQLVATPTGPVTFFDANASMTGSLRPQPSLLWRETTTFNDFDPIHGEAAHTLGLTQDLRHEHQWARDTFTLDLTLGYLNADGFAASLASSPTPIVTPRIETAQGQLLAGWRRDLTPELYASLEVGVFVLDSLLADQSTIGPAARAILHYQRELALADLTIEHAPEPSYLVGETLVSDSATLRALLPLDKKQRFRFVAIGIAQQGSVLSTSGLDAAVDLLAVETGVTFQPIGYPLLASLDYSAQDQMGHQPPGATGTTTVFPSIHRQMVMLTLTGTLGSNGSRGGATGPTGWPGSAGSPASPSVDERPLTTVGGGT